MNSVRMKAEVVQVIRTEKNKSQQEKEVRRGMTGYRESIEKKREDAKEMIEILEKIPKERKPEALALVKGFALCAELDEKKVG